MADDDPPPPDSNRSSGVRRRSLHRHDIDAGTVLSRTSSEDTHADSPHPTTPRQGHEHGNGNGTGTDRPDQLHPVASASSAVEPTPRVRFSMEIETPGPEVASTGGRGASEPTTPRSLRRPEVDNPGEQTPGAGLGSELDAPDDAVPVSTILEQGRSRSGASGEDAPRERSTSPVAPAGRSRGYSLRRTLFQRNVDTHQSKAATVIELVEPAGPSAGNEPGNGVKSRKSIESIVPVSSTGAGVGGDALSRLQAMKAEHGVSALPNYANWVQKRRHGRNEVTKRIRTLYRRARRFVLRIQEIPASADGRHVELDAFRKRARVDERTGREYVGNTIRSTRYTAWNFVPRQLFAQFSKLANFYFLSVSILQMIPGLSTTGTYTTIVPLLVFVMLAMAKEGYDDLRRYRLDKGENNRDAQVLHAYEPTSAQVPDGPPKSPSHGPLVWAATKWRDLKVGDIVRLERDDAAPADLALLHSDGPNNIAYIETMALDGETNLKTKQAAPSVAKSCTDLEAIAACRAKFVVEDPNLDLYNFEGRVTVDDETAPLTNNEIVYRGSILRNTPEAIGMVIYSGEECKIRMNANKNPRIKAPQLQAIVNKIVIVVVVFVILLALFNTVAYQIWKNRHESRSWYLENARVAFFPILASFIIMFNTLIPLSLYVSLEIIKLAQMYFLNDIDMYDEVSNTPCEPRTSTINEELGQVSYIFSDKTGTLTDNSMKFRKISVAGTAWLHDVDLVEGECGKKKLMHKKRKGKSLRAEQKSRLSESGKRLPADKSGTDAIVDADVPPESSAWKSSARPAKSQPELRTRELIRYIQRRPNTLFARKARMFLLSIALCHTCLPEKQPDGTVDFQASSPDEIALIRAAQELGYLAINRDAYTLTLTHPHPDGSPTPITQRYDILDIIEFSSRRKRMSAVVRFPDGRVCVLCKGADSVVMQLLKNAALANQKVVEIEGRANRRKSLEAQFAIQRRSEQLAREVSVTRPSLSLSLGRPSVGGLSRPSMSLNVGRPSFGGLSRPSMSGGRLRPIRDTLDDWLTERETDVDASNLESHAPYYSPRPSAQLGRPSMVGSEARSSMQLDEMDDLVEEAMVADEAAVFERCFQHINDFATEGLRTLLYGFRFLTADEYSTWKKVYLDATTSLVDRQNMIEQAGELIETDLELAGATAIEDKLQKGVPEAIDKLRRANIKMWMLTGDKRETAINIGHSCRLIKDYSIVTVLDQEAGEVEQHIAAAILGINDGSVAHSVVVVDGQTLATIEADAPIRALFFDLAILADSVVCCRASPSQKASLVKAIRKRVKKSITLAIGDGANDIAMIQEAHVGIGITGKEGLQAARTSDYSIAQFRFLTKLLLVHGRWNYVRTCKYTVGTFWKEMLFYLTQALFQRWAGYTGTSLYEPWSLSMFNTLFTSLPVIFMGIFEKDLAASTLLAVPELYNIGQQNRGFNFKVYLWWTFMASCEAMVVYFCMLGLYGQAVFTKDQGLWALGDMTFTAVVIIISLKMQVIEMHNKSIAVAISLFLSILAWFLWNIILAALYKDSNDKIYNVKGGIYSRFGTNPSWWLSLILIITAVFIFEIAVSSLLSAYLPNDVNIFQQLEQDLGVRKRFEEAAADELQQGWDRGTKKSSVELVKERAEEAEREGQVQEILRHRFGSGSEGREDGRSSRSGEGNTLGETMRKSVEWQERMKKAFGSVQ